MRSKRRLTDLFVVGKESSIDDGGEPIVVWIQKVNAVQHAEGVRRADARRARCLSVKRRPESDEYMAVLGAVYNLGDRENLINYLVIQEELKIREKRESENASEEEWKTDNYFQGLRDAWHGTDDNPGLDDRYAREPDDAEAKRVFDELKRFDTQVSEAVNDELDDLRRDFERETDEEIEAKVVSSFIDLQANTEWLDEFYRCQIWFGVRDPDHHKKQYFESRAEVDELETSAINLLRNAFETINVEVIEGKDSPAVPDSSVLSGPSSAEATTPSSGLAAVTA